MAKPSLPLAPRPPVAPPEPERVSNTKPSALIHLARTPAQAKANMMPSPSSESPAYGYGLELNLDHDQTQKLGIGAPAPGSKIHATVHMHVTSSASEPTTGGGMRNRVALTVTHMKVHGAAGTKPVPVKRVGVPSAPTAKRGQVAVASHLRRAPKAKATPSRGAFVKPPTVKRA